MQKPACPNHSISREECKPSQGLALVVFAAFLSYVCGGCLSNEYVIPQAELARLAQLPPEQRGQQVQVVQNIGERRSDAIDTSQPPPPPPPDAYQGQPAGPPPEGYVESGPEPHVGVGIIIAPAPPIPFGPRVYGGPTGPGPRGPVVGSRGRVAPGRVAHSPRGGKLGSGGGGKDDLIAFVVAIAVLATVGMIATEGARYDGIVAMYPWQPVHLRDDSGQEREVPLAQITPMDVTPTTTAVVMDDEGWGMMRLGRRFLDRRGLAFKLGVGGFHSSCSCLSADSAAMSIGFGYFPHHVFGILGTWSFAGGSDSADNSFYRHNLALEAEVFPLSAWRLHLGGFAHAGVQYADDEAGGTRSAAAFGGGALLEIALTTRLALTVRADYTAAKVRPETNGWAGSEMFTFGVAIY
jgi:hypothetical protein